MNFSRIARQLKHPHWWYRRLFDAETCSAISAAIREAERSHRGELRFVAEGALPWGHLWRDCTARQRAVELFGQLRVWDTEDNCGILIYVQLADRRVEILADRGIAAKVPQADWEYVCRAMEQQFGAGLWREGALAGIAGAAELLSHHFPAVGAHTNELPDAPLIL